MVTVPAAIPVITPVVYPAVAMLVLPLVHVPPLTRSLSVVVEPIHVLVTPLMATGALLTVIVVVVMHPVPGAL